MNKSLHCIIQEVCNVDAGNRLTLHEPNFANSNAENYVNECISTGWVSSAGKFVDKFEDSISTYTKSTFSVAVNNGTAALRLALQAVGVERDSEVLMPSLTFVATANAISHLGAYPHFIDICAKDLGLSPINLDSRLSEIAVKEEGFVINKLTGRKIKAVVFVHVFGNPGSIIEIKKVCEKWDLPLVEDAAEALGSWVDGTHCGLIGDVGCISFNGNKIITTGGGGTIITNSKSHADFCRHISTTAKKPHPWEFDHDMIGWNERMPNINAAIGLAQMECLDEKLAKKKTLHSKYIEAFSSIANIDIVLACPSVICNNWLNTIRFNNEDVQKAKIKRLEEIELCHSNNVLVRPVWKPIHQLIMYTNHQSGKLETTESESLRLLSLPSSPQLV